MKKEVELWTRLKILFSSGSDLNLNFSEVSGLMYNTQYFLVSFWLRQELILRLKWTLNLPEINICILKAFKFSSENSQIVR